MKALLDTIINKRFDDIFLTDCIKEILQECDMGDWNVRLHDDIIFQNARLVFHAEYISAFMAIHKLAYAFHAKPLFDTEDKEVILVSDLRIQIVREIP